jgi:hypothetical protein
MIVAELIAKLQALPQEMLVVTEYDDAPERLDTVRVASVDEDFGRWTEDWPPGLQVVVLK